MLTAHNCFLWLTGYHPCCITLWTNSLHLIVVWYLILKIHGFLEARSTKIIMNVCRKWKGDKAIKQNETNNGTRRMNHFFEPKDIRIIWICRQESWSVIWLHKMLLWFFFLRKGCRYDSLTPECIFCLLGLTMNFRDEVLLGNIDYIWMSVVISV